MNYDIKYLEVRCSLIDSFLKEAESNVLDISYTVEGGSITIQIVLLENTTLSEKSRARIANNLQAFVVTIIEIYISKEKFNDYEGVWLPQHYNWMSDVLFSKAKII